MKLFYCFYLCICMVVACNNLEDEKILSVSDSVFCKAVSGQNDMGFDLLREISKQEPGKNILISPSGIYLGLSMTANGAADSTLRSMLGFMKLHGFSKNELNRSGRSVMHYLKEKYEYNFESEEDSLKFAADTVEFKIANLLCMNENSGVHYKKKFISDIIRYYDTKPQSLSFSDPGALAVINGWAAEKTNNRIKDILPKLDNNVTFIIMNALYFKGQWEHKFNPDKTTDRPFKLNDTTQVLVPMMEQNHEFELFEDKELSALRMPYFGGFSMVIILPNKTDGLEKLLSGLNNERWDNIKNNMKRRDYKIIIPRFKYEYSRSMEDDVKNLGMRQPFDEQQADFSDMADANLCLSKIIQKTYIEVDEKGSEAAAVSAILGRMIGISDFEKNIFRADHPFLYMIIHNRTGIIAFSGIVRHFEGSTSKTPEFPENPTDLIIEFKAGKIIGIAGNQIYGAMGLYPLSVKELEKEDPHIDRLSETVNNSMEVLLNCYYRILKKNPTAKGIFSIQVGIDARGRVTQTSVKRNMFDSEFGLCVGNTIRKWVFPECKKGQLTVDLKFVFNKKM